MKRLCQKKTTRNLNNDKSFVCHHAQDRTVSIVIITTITIAIIIKDNYSSGARRT